MAGETAGQVDAASAQESGPCVTVESTMPAWESSNNAQRLSHNAPGATHGLLNVLGNVGLPGYPVLSFASLSSYLVFVLCSSLLSRPLPFLSHYPRFFPRLLRPSKSTTVEARTPRLGKRHPSRQGSRETSSRCRYTPASHACAREVDGRPPGIAERDKSLRGGRGRHRVKVTGRP